MNRRNDSSELSPGGSNGNDKPILAQNTSQSLSSSLRSKRSTESIQFAPPPPSRHIHHVRKGSYQEEPTRNRSGGISGNSSHSFAPTPTREIPTIFRRRSRSPASMSPAASVALNSLISPARRNSGSGSAWQRQHLSGVCSVTISGSGTLPPLQANGSLSEFTSPISAASSTAVDNANFNDGNNADSVTAIIIPSNLSPQPFSVDTPTINDTNNNNISINDNNINSNSINKSAEVNGESVRDIGNLGSVCDDDDDGEGDSDNTYVFYLKCNELMVDKTTLGMVAVYIIQVTRGMTSSLWEISRRFNQFYSLNLDLTLKLPGGIVLPKLPSRYVLRSSTDPSIIMERKTSLQKYLDAISRIPAVTASEDFKRFIDPKNNPDLYSISNPTISGILTKSRILHSSYSTYVVVATPLFVYYDAQKSHQPLDAPKKVLHLAGATVKLEKNSSTFVVTFKSGLITKFSAEDSETAEEWVEKIKEAISEATPKSPGGGGGSDKRSNEKAPETPKQKQHKCSDCDIKQQKPQRPQSHQYQQQQQQQQNQQQHQQSQPSNQIIQASSSVSSVVSLTPKEKPQQQQQQQQQKKASKGALVNKTSRSMSVAAFGHKGMMLSEQSQDASERKKRLHNNQSQRKKGADFTNIVENVKQKTDSKLRGIINSLQPSSSTSTPASPTSSPAAATTPGTPRISPELSNRLIEIATTIISTDADELLAKQMCRDFIYELQDLEKQERHHAIRFMIHDISELSRVLEAKRGHDRTERMERTERNNNNSNSNSSSKNGGCFHKAKQHSTNELPFFALPGKFDDNVTQLTATAAAAATTAAMVKATSTSPSSSSATALPAIDVPKEYLTSKTPTETTSASLTGEKAMSGEGALPFTRSGSSIDIRNGNAKPSGSGVGSAEADTSYFVGSFPTEKFAAPSIFSDSTETDTRSRSDSTSNNSGSINDSKSSSFSDLLQYSPEAAVNRFVGRNELENISSVVSSMRSPTEIVVCRNCDESFPRYLLREHTDYCIPAVTLATQNKKSDERITEIAAAIEEKRDALAGFEEFDSTPYTKLILVARDIASLKCGSEELTRRCRRFLMDLQTYLTNNDLDLFLLAYGNALLSVLEEKYAAMTRMLQIQQENGTQKEKRSIWSFIPFLKLYKSYQASRSVNDADDSDSESCGDSKINEGSEGEDEEGNEDEDDGSVVRKRISIEDFTFIKKISSGAYGRVFLARKNTTYDLYAVKVLLKEDTIRKNMIESVNAERQIMSSVSNPFVVNLYYAFQDELYLYLVMEYCPGGDVGTLLKNLGAFDLEMTRTYAAEIVLALESLHSLNYVHRDLKPDNLLISATGHIVLADFGLSSVGVMMDQVDAEKQPKDKSANNNNNNSKKPSQSLLSNSQSQSSQQGSQQQQQLSPPGLMMPERGRIVGTPDYLAPEVLCGLEHGPEVDWWALGVIIFEFITSVPPFNGDSPDEIFDNILDMRIPWPPTSDEVGENGECLGFPSVARDFVEKLLVKDPAKRLGHNGAAEIKAHPFFEGINWDTLINEPRDDIFVPVLDDPEDTSYFEDHGSVNDANNNNIGNNSSQTSPSGCDNNGSNNNSTTTTPPVATATGCPIPGMPTSPSPLLSVLSSAAPFSPLAIANNPVMVDPEHIGGFTLHSQQSQLSQLSQQQQQQQQGQHSQHSSPLSASASASPVCGSVGASSGATAGVSQANDSVSGSDSAKKDKKKKKGKDFRNFEFVNTKLIKQRNLDIVNGNPIAGTSPSMFPVQSPLLFPAAAAGGSASPASSASSGGVGGSSCGSSGSGLGRSNPSGFGMKVSPSVSPAPLANVGQPVLSSSSSLSSSVNGSNPIVLTNTTFSKSGHHQHNHHNSHNHHNHHQQHGSGNSSCEDSDDSDDDNGELIVINDKDNGKRLK